MKVVDMHCDTISALLKARRKGEEVSLRKNPFHLDLEKMSIGDYLLQNFALFVEMEACQDPWLEVQVLLDLYEEEMQANADWILPVLSTADIKKNRELENRRMTLEEYLEDEKILMGLETRREDIMDILEEFGEIPKSLFDRIMLEDEMRILKKMLKAAAKADSLEQFEELISNL